MSVIEMAVFRREHLFELKICFSEKHLFLVTSFIKYFDGSLILVMQKAEQHRIHMPFCQCDSHFSQSCIPDHQVLAACFAPCDNYCVVLLHKTQP